MKCITIVGNLGANAVRRMTSDGRELMTFSVAVSERKDETVWFNVVASLREKLFPYLLKGQCVSVVGDLNVGLYKGQIDLSVNIDKCELCGARSEQNSQQSAQPTAPVESFDAANQQTL